MESSSSAMAQTLQIADRDLTLLGQALDGLRRRQGGANIPMIALAACVELPEEPPIRPVVDRRASWWGDVRWN